MFKGENITRTILRYADVISIIAYNGSQHWRLADAITMSGNYVLEDDPESSSATINLGAGRMMGGPVYIDYYLVLAVIW